MNFGPLSTEELYKNKQYYLIIFRYYDSTPINRLAGRFNTSPNQIAIDNVRLCNTILAARKRCELRNTLINIGIAESELEKIVGKNASVVQEVL